MTQRSALAMVALVAAWIAAGCSDLTMTRSARGTDGPAVVVDPRAGRVGDVRLGDGPPTVAASFGAGRADEELGGRPLKTDAEAIGAPFNYPFPAGCREPAHVDNQDATPTAVTGRDYGLIDVSYRWAGASFCKRRAFILLVTSRGSKTTAGAEIGQSLEQAHEAHPTLTCDVSTGATTDPPVPVFEYCSGQITDERYLWLGQDPISSIAISTIPLK